MIGPLLRASRLSLTRDRVAQVMTFVLPIAFFSIFAMVFGRGTMNEIDPIPVAVVDEDQSTMSRALIASLEKEGALRVRDSARAQGASARSARRAPIDRERARALVSDGDMPVAIVIPKGFGATFPNLMGGGMPVDLFVDPSEQIARQIVTGLLQRSAARVVRSGMSGWMAAAAPEAGGSVGGASGSGGALESGGAGASEPSGTPPSDSAAGAALAPDPLSLVPAG